VERGARGSLDGDCAELGGGQDCRAWNVVGMCSSLMEGGMSVLGWKSQVVEELNRRGCGSISVRG